MLIYIRDINNYHWLFNKTFSNNVFMMEEIFRKSRMSKLFLLSVFQFKFEKIKSNESSKMPIINSQFITEFLIKLKTFCFNKQNSCKNFPSSINDWNCIEKCACKINLLML